MGGMVDCGVGLDSKTSPRRAAIEKAQEELRLEYDVREERRRELEFLEKGGNPLDFKFGNVASLSVQSTSLNVTSEAKGSFSLAPSPHGDSVESSGPNMADNLLLLDGDNSNPVSGPEKSNNVLNRNGNGNNTREQEEPGILRFARRNRSRPANNAVRPAMLSSKDAAKPCTNEASKTVLPEEEKEKEKEKEKDNPMPVPPVPNSKPDSPRKSEPTLGIVQPEEVATDREVGPAQMNVSERVEEAETTQTIEKPAEKVEAPNGSVENETEAVNMDLDVSNITKSRCDDEIPAPSAVLNNGNTDSEGVPACNSTADNGLIEKEGSGTATGTHATELDSKAVVQLEQTDSTSVQIKDEKEEEIRLQKPSGDETIAEAESNKDDTCTAEPALDAVGVVPLPPVDEVAAAAPTEEEAKVAQEHEDEILEKARIIEADLKRAGEMPSSRLALEKRRKSHWDFVLEEMAWMANDFMQEHLWKVAAASQMCRWIANGGREKFEEANLQRRQTNMARTVAKAVMSFWHSVDAERKQVKSCTNEDGTTRQDRLSIKKYAIRVLDYQSGIIAGPVLAEAPTTPDRPSDKGVLLVLKQLPEESLFYTVPPGASQAYRESVESQFAQYKKTGTTAYHDECETSNSVADISRENAYEEDEVQTGTYAYEGGFSPKFSKKRKHPVTSHHRAYTPRLHETGSQALSQEPYMETKPPTQTQVLSNGKRPLHSPNIVIIPAKKVRTQVPGRKPGPHFGGGMAAGPHTGVKMDASSDTNSYQEERASLQHCDSFGKRNMEVESPVGRGLSYEEVTARSKKKKPKYSEPLYSSIGSGKNSSFEHRSHADASLHHDQKDQLRSRIEGHQIDNGNNVMYGQHGPRKLKISPSRQEDVGLTGGAVMSTGPSHNVSNSKQLIKIINSGRDRGANVRKGKGAKLAAIHSGPGSPWSSYEDQTLVVLVHDLGPNWELISESINNTLLFKHCIHRRAKECKERHRYLMEQRAIDGADSAEDSGSSQPYTQLPGIPKGTARELFQKLQGPLEEDTIKSHFEKIISLSQKLRPRKNNQELKQTMPAPPHNSHVNALSQVCPNNLGGTILTPLDLSDAPSPSNELPQLGYGGPHANGLPLASHQGSIGAPMLPPTSNMGSVIQGSPGLVLPGSLPSPSNPLNTPTREPQRYGMPRGPVQDEQQQRIQQQYNQMVSGRSLPQPGMPLSGPLPPSAVDRGGPVRMLPPGGGSGSMSMMPSGSGLARGMPPVPRPGFQRLNSPAMLNMVSSSGNMLSASGPGLQGPMNPMLRPRDSMQLIKPGQNMDEHSRQMMMQEMQLQQMPSQGNNNGGVQFGAGPTSSISTNSTTSPSVQSFPPVPSHGPQTPHQQMFTNHTTPQQQAYAMHMAKERQQMQQKQQQQRMMPPAQQSPIMASASSPGPGPGCQAQQQQKNLPECSAAAPTAPGPGPKKQKQNTQQRQNNQSTKGSKGRGGGSILMHQTLAGPGSVGLNPSMPQQPGNQPNKLYPSPSPMAPLGGASRLGPPHAVDSAQVSQMPSDSGNTNQQEGISGSEMLIGPGPISSSGPNQGMMVGQRPPGIGGAHWQPKNQVQNNNSSRSGGQGNVYGQPSNSGAG